MYFGCIEILEGKGLIMNCHELVLINTRKKGSLFAVLAGMAFLLLFIWIGFGMENADADQLRPQFSSTDGSACTDISDSDYFTTEYFDPGTEVTLSSSSNIDSLYIVWEEDPGKWTLQIDGSEYVFGGSGYLHEYVKLPGSGANSVTLVVGDSRITIADIYAFSDGPLPDFVQTWEPSYDKADVLLISTHADDEVLFFGGIIPDYADKGDVRIQVAYFSDLYQSEPYRNHEILNGLWTMGVTHYPQLGEFYDYYSESFEEAQEQYNYNDSLEYIVRTIRRFKPQVVIGQDIMNGEYGHGGHMWTASIIADAVELTADEDSYPDSVSKYGTWDVPKTYFHLYPEKTIELDARKPLTSFGGKTELEVAKLAYLEHQSQQWCWFYVSDGYDDEGNPDGYEYSCTRYGLYRSLVGDDFSGNDILDNITTYDQQEIKAAQEAEAARLALERETETETEPSSAESVIDENTRTAVPGGRNTTAITLLIIAAAIVLAVIIGIIVISAARRKEARRRQELKRRRNQVVYRDAQRTERRPSTSYRTPDQAPSYRQARPSGSRSSRNSNGTYSSDRSRRR